VSHLCVVLRELLDRDQLCLSDLAEIGELSEMQAWRVGKGKSRTTRKVLRKFLAKWPDDAVRLQKAWECDHAPELAAELHALREAAGGFDGDRAPGLAKALADLPPTAVAGLERLARDVQRRKLPWKVVLKRWRNDVELIAELRG